jgi:putative ABC transport system substrate-binding protein
MALADELVRRQVAVVVTAGSNNAAQAARAATTHVPIVFTTGSDPVRLGLVASLNRPGGNATGVTYLAAELGPKRLELLRELVPQAGTIAFLVNPTSSNTKLNTEDMQTAARGIAQQISISSASTASEIETAFAALARQQVGGLLINNDAFFASRPEQFVALAARHRIPTVHFAPQFTRAGGLMSYSDDRLESWRQAGIYVGRILKGEKPADLPVQRATKVELIINMQAARVLGLTIPPTLRALASEVIE